jgi:hypothetical protein
LAFQVYLVRKIGFKVSGAYLVRLNKGYVRAGDLNLKQLFVVEDVIQFIDEILPAVEEEVQSLVQLLGSSTEPKGPCCCIYKGRSNHCTAFTYYNAEVPKYSVHDLTRIGGSKKRLCELIDAKIFDILDIPADFEFGKKIKKQVEVHKSGRAHIEYDEIKQELDTLKYPLYFLDYETFNPAIPRFSGFKPYQHIPFQFSVHTLNSPEGELVHKEFLYTGKQDPSKLFLAALQENIGEVGSIIVWNKSFEGSNINKPLAIRVPDGAEFLTNLNTRLFDLMTIFSRQLHIHPDFHGSASIKKVLPVLCPELSYEELDIGNGSEAMNTWNKLVTEEYTEDDKLKIETAMKKYCELDTMAMYAIWKCLIGILKERAIDKIIASS